MNIHLRFIRTIVKGYLNKHYNSNTSTASRLNMRVWPMDLDLNMHQNNGRYLSCMDIGRFDLAFALGLHIPIFKHKWMPLLGSSTIRYRKSLAFWQSFELVTTIAGWDEKWVFMQQEFRVKGETYALGATKVLFRSKQGNIPTATLMEYANIEEQSPQLPKWIQDWHLADQALGARIKFNKDA